MKEETLQPRTLKKVRLCLTNGNLVNNYNTIRWEGARRVSSPIGGPFLWSQTFDWTNCLLMDFWGLQLYGSCMLPLAKEASEIFLLVLPESRIYAVKKQLTDTSLKEKTTIHPIFLSLQKLTNDPMCVTESHWLKNQQCIVYRFQCGLCPCTAFTWTWRWTCGATSTACENLTYKVMSRRFKFHDSITSRSISQMLADLSGVEFKIIVSKFRKR